MSFGLSANYLVSDAEVHFSFAEGALALRDQYRFEFSDVYADLGVLLKLSDRISIGAVYHSGFETELIAIHVFQLAEQVREDRISSDLSWPSGYAFGFAWRPLDRMILAADYGAMHWSESKIRNLGPFPAIFVGSQGDETSLRFGSEYNILIAGELSLALRAGMFQNQRPASMYGPQGVAPQYNGWSVGGGMAFDRIRIDLGYVHTRGQEMGGAMRGDLLISAPEEGGAPLHVEVPARSSRVSSERILFTLAVTF